MNYFYEKKEKGLLLILEITTKDYLREKDSSPEIEQNLRAKLDEILKCLDNLRTESSQFDKARAKALLL